MYIHRYLSIQHQLYSYKSEFIPCGQETLKLCPDLPSRPGLAAKPLLAASLEAGAAAHGATEHRPRRASVGSYGEEMEVGNMEHTWKTREDIDPIGI